MSDRGIDYSGPGATCNRSEDGIRYGVICINDLCDFALEEFEPDYGDPTCPRCGNDVENYSDAVVKIEAQEVEGIASEEDLDNYYDSLLSCADYVCLGCGIILGSDEVYGDEPVGGWILDDGEYLAQLDEYNDVFLVKSPYKTRSQFCSPCAPGACHLGHPISVDDNPDHPWCFAFGHDWFNGDKAPYRVFSVSTGEEVFPEAKEDR